jgi:hypothetical protein
LGVVMKYMKNVRSILLLGILAASFLGIFTVINVRGQETESVLIYATGNGPVDMDIANSWDSASGDVID